MKKILAMIIFFGAQLATLVFVLYCHALVVLDIWWSIVTPFTGGAWIISVFIWIFILPLLFAWSAATLITKDGSE